MNGYELVRLQPQQVKKSGDTITGNLTATGGAKFVGNLQGNADTATAATRLQTARKINGTDFNGTGDITTANWGTSRNIQIGNTAKAVNGSGNVTWNLAEIGASDINHNHDNRYLQLTGGTVTGRLNLREGYVVHGAHSGSGTHGYFHIAEIKINDFYMNQPIRIEYFQRECKQVSTLEIQFMWANSNDPGLSVFVKTGDTNAFIHKSAASTWNIYVQKKEAHDFLDIVGFSKGTCLVGVTVIWRDATVTNLPGGNVAATLKNTITNITGNSDTATRLQTARNITVGNATRSFDGTGNVNFSLQDIGASASNHNHDNAYLKLTGGTMSGSILLNANNTVSIGTHDKKLHTVYTGVIDFGGTTGIYPRGQYALAFKCGRQQGGQAGELFYEHNGTTYHFEPKWSGDVPLPESTGLGRSARKWRDVWSHAGSLQTSDITQKENVKKVASEVMLLNADESIEEYSNLSSEAVTSVVQNIQPITFDYKGMRKNSEDDGVMDISEDDEAGKVGRQLGISAQELEKLNPTLFEYVGVKTMVENKDGDLVPSYSIKTLAYTNMLLVALQETMKKVELLEKELEDVKAKI